MGAYQDLLDDRKRAVEELQVEKTKLRRAQRQGASDVAKVIEERIAELENEIKSINKEINALSKREKAKHYGGKAANALSSGVANAVKTMKENSENNSGREELENEVNELRDELSDRSNSGGGSGHFKKHGHKYLMIFFFILHFLLVLGFSPGTGAGSVLTMSIILLILSTLILYVKTQDPAVIGLALAEVAVPWVLNFFPTGGFIMDFLTALWIFSPVLALYLSVKADSKFHRVWGVLWAIALLAVIINSGILQPFFPEVAGNLDPFGALETFGLQLWTSISDIWDGIWSGAGTIKTTVESSINYATGGYYAGMVEKQQGEPVGLYIEDVRESSDLHFEGDPVYLWVDLRGKSFKDTINVQTTCTARGEEKTYTGKTEPSSFDIFLEKFESVQCLLEDLTAGEYDVTFTAGFNFETWSYVTYTFVDQQTRLSYLSQDKNINKDLDIDQSLKPIYTPGPVSLGMSSDIPQPVGIDMDSERPLNTLFGVSLVNLWTDGGIARVREFDVMVPEQFQLKNCDAEFEVLEEDPLCEENSDVCASNMNVYRFENDDSPRKFTKIDCRMYLEEGVEPDEVVGFGQKKAQKTFVVKATYDYVLQEDENVEVEAYDVE